MRLGSCHRGFYWYIITLVVKAKVHLTHVLHLMEDSTLNKSIDLNLAANAKILEN